MARILIMTATCFLFDKNDTWKLNAPFQFVRTLRTVGCWLHDNSWQTTLSLLSISLQTATSRLTIRLQCRITVGRIFTASGRWLSNVSCNQKCHLFRITLAGRMSYLLLKMMDLTLSLQSLTLLSVSTIDVIAWSITIEYLKFFPNSLLIRYECNHSPTAHGSVPCCLEIRGTEWKSPRAHRGDFRRECC